MLTQTLRFDADHHDDIVYPSAIPFTLVHLAVIGILWSGVTWTAAAMCVGLYVLRMFAITAGLHRYFSHRTYDTSRAFQFVLAFLSQTSLQKGVFWWSAKHRHHHKYSDTAGRRALARHPRVLVSHVGWIFVDAARSCATTEWSRIWRSTPSCAGWTSTSTFRASPWAWRASCSRDGRGCSSASSSPLRRSSTATFAINSLAHCFGRQRYLTGDDSRNNWWLAFITLGEGWHNNHHYYQVSTRQGFRWYEIDVTYYVLKVLSWVGIVWNLHTPPEEVLLGERRLSRRAIDKVAHRLAGTFHVDSLVAQARDAWSHKPDLELPDLHVPHLPSLEELKRRASQMALRTPSLDDVASRAREILAEAVALRLAQEAVPA